MPTARTVAALVCLVVTTASANPPPTPAYFLTVTKLPSFALNKVTYHLGMGRAEFERDFGKPERAETPAADDKLAILHYDSNLAFVAFFYGDQLYGIDFHVLEPGKAGVRCTVKLDNGLSDKSSIEDVKKVMGKGTEATPNASTYMLKYPNIAFSFLKGQLVGFNLTADKAK